jgi:hypothetical protein
MNKRFTLTEEERKEIRKNYFFEQKTSEEMRFCHKGNTKSLDDIMGADEYEDYVENIKIRKNGVRGLTDALETLRSYHNLENVNDGGVHLCNNVMNTLKAYKPYNYFEEQSKECNRAMDKIIELYKENEHGEELVSDIEKVMSFSHIEPRAKEFLKHSLSIIKGD